jgi:mannose-1-phosphate guanylyltransferase/phosphomannomutase
MRAVVMAGGEGTRLRPLTSNQPKPMVPIADKPCMEHIIELLKRHGIDDIVVTVAFLPKIIRGYFSDGETLGVNLSYSVEQQPLGTAGSVKNAEAELGETFIVISGDALTDFDRRHRQRAQAAAAGDHRPQARREPARVRRGRHRRRGAYRALSREADVGTGLLGHGQHRRLRARPRSSEVYIPAGRQYGFSWGCSQAAGARQAALRLHRRRLTGGISAACNSTWPPAATSRRKVEANILGIRLSENIWIGENVNVESLDNVTGPAMIGNYAKIDRDARISPYSVLGSNVVVKGHAETRFSVIDSNVYIGNGTKVYGAIIGKNCDINAGVTISDGAAIGDECVIGEQAMIAPDVKIYPFKTVEAGAQIHSSIIWESRGASRLFGKDGVVGLINVDITPELGLKLAQAYGTMLPKGAKVVTSRDPHPASRIVKRAMISGFNATGVNVRDLRVSSAAVNRFEVKSGNAQGGVHVRVSSLDPRSCRSSSSSRPASPSPRRHEGHREVPRPPGLSARVLHRNGGDPVPLALERDVRAWPDELLGRGAHPQPRLSPGDRLLLLTGGVDPAQRARQAGRRGARAARLHRRDAHVGRLRELGTSPACAAW